MPDVFELTIASARLTASTRAISACLASRRSTIASTIQSASRDGRQVLVEAAGADEPGGLGREERIRLQLASRAAVPRARRRA